MYKEIGQSWEMELFSSFNYTTPKRHYFYTQISRNVDQVIGNLFSMSWSSKNLLGAKALKFEKEFRQRLYVLAGAEKFIDRVQFCVYFLRK
jgi:hypothetical protein